jgi:hypothetical protein
MEGEDCLQDFAGETWTEDQGLYGIIFKWILYEIWREGFYWIRLVYDRRQQRALANTKKKLHVPYSAEFFSQAKKLVRPLEGFTPLVSWLVTYLVS